MQHNMHYGLTQPKSSKEPCDTNPRPIPQRKFLNYEPDLVSSSTTADSHHPDSQASDTATI